VLIVGGGPIGVEIAGEITQERKRTKVTIVEKESTLLPRADPVLQRWAADHLRKRGARILLGQSLIFPMIPPDEADFSGGRAVTDQREEIDYDLALWCFGARPNASYLMTHFQGSLDRGGYVSVAPNFLMSGTENIFAVGDVANLPVKGALWIDSQLKVLLPNLRAAIGGKRADSFAGYRPKLHPQTTIITLGRNGGLVRLPFGRSQWSPIARSLKAEDMLVGRYRKAVGLHPTKD
jgi:NADH dehydrogenase FAD-containing subunit